MRCITLCSMLLLTSLTPQSSFASLPKSVEQFLQDNCLQCHDAKVKKGGLDLANLALDSAKPEAFRHWVEAFDRVQAGVMPPKTQPRPEAGAHKAFLAALGDSLRDVDQKRIAAQGRVPARRLTRFE